MIYLASPYRATHEVDTSTHIEYARRALHHSLKLGESPVAPHLLYPQVLDDDIPDQRLIGIRANADLIESSGRVAFYVDYGMSPGMVEELRLANEYKVPIDIRSISRNFEEDTRVEAPPEAIAVPSMTPQADDWDIPPPPPEPAPLPPGYRPGDRLPVDYVHEANLSVDEALARNAALRPPEGHDEDDTILF